MNKFARRIFFAIPLGVVAFVVNPWLSVPVVAFVAYQYTKFVEECV